jgi:hypothetical protein
VDVTGTITTDVETEVAPIETTLVAVVVIGMAITVVSVETNVDTKVVTPTYVESMVMKSTGEEVDVVAVIDVETSKSTIEFVFEVVVTLQRISIDLYDLGKPLLCGS